jgi:hypothetical protein
VTGQIHVSAVLTAGDERLRTLNGVYEGGWCNGKAVIRYSEGNRFESSPAYG